MHMRFPLLAAAAALLLSACSPDADSDGSAVATRGPDAWRMSPAGFGPLRAGQSVAEAAAAVGGEFSLPDGASPECAYAVWPTAPAGVRVMVEHDTVVRVEVKEGNVSTEGGARIGDSEGRINSLYNAGQVLMRPHKYTTGKYLIVNSPTDTMFRFVFETDGTNVTEFRSGRVPAVEYVEGCS